MSSVPERRGKAFASPPHSAVCREALGQADAVRVSNSSRRLCALMLSAPTGAKMASANGHKATDPGEPGRQFHSVILFPFSFFPHGWLFGFLRALVLDTETGNSPAKRPFPVVTAMKIIKQTDGRLERASGGRLKDAVTGPVVSRIEHDTATRERNRQAGSGTAQGRCQAIQEHDLTACPGIPESGGCGMDR